MSLRLEPIPVEYPELKKKLFDLQRLYGLVHDTYLLAYRPYIKESIDARVTVFAKCANVISTTFGAHFMIENMLSDEWWRKTPPWSNEMRLNPKYDRRIELREYNVFLKSSFIILTFRAIESSFRDYIRTLLPTACEKGNGDFRCVHCRLLERLKLDKEENKKLLNLYTLTRNLMHNNGVYSPSWNPDEVNNVEYKDKIYTFTPKKRVEFVTWSFALMLVQDSLDLLCDVVNHPDIVSKNEIKDSFVL